MDISGLSQIRIGDLLETSTSLNSHTPIVIQSPVGPPFSPFTPTQNESSITSLIPPYLQSLPHECHKCTMSSLSNK